MVKKEILEELYQSKKLSVMQIAHLLNLNAKTIEYWIKCFGIKMRSRKEAMYIWHNPNGDPFAIKTKLDEHEKFLFGMGLGLFWGEGMKASKYGVRLGNTDPFLILYFRDFLQKLCGVQLEKIKYSLQLFGDVDEQKAVQFWCHTLKIQPKNLGKISLIKLRGKGTYKKKNEFGVLQIACHNKKLKLIMDSFLRTLKTQYPAHVAQLVEHVHGEPH